MEKAKGQICPDEGPKEGSTIEWFQTLMFSDGYAMNLRSGVNLSTMQINRLKSHDYHIWLERLLSVMVRGYVSLSMSG